jgi:hypothetical protein
MAHSTRILLLVVVGCLTVASCEAGSSDTTQAAMGTPAAIHAIAADSVGVTGTAECGFFNTGTDLEDPGAEEGDLVECELEMSDPRVSGIEVHDRFHYYDTGAQAFAWVAEEATITNADGSWRGLAQAVDDGTPIGEARYIGEGAYDGLEFHYYFSHPSISGQAELHGWISGETS